MVSILNQSLASDPFAPSHSSRMLTANANSIIITLSSNGSTFNVGSDPATPALSGVGGEPVQVLDSARRSSIFVW